MNILVSWKGVEYDSVENLRVDHDEYDAMITSDITGYYQHMIYTFQYMIQTDANWCTKSLDLIGNINGDQKEIRLVESEGTWTLNDQVMPDLEGCIDIDIPLTPFTNTLPIRRLKLARGQTTLIKVAYIDLLAGEIYPVHQQYSRISEHVYHYENVPNDFEADIETDANGLVVNYPALFKRIFMVDLAQK